MATVKKPQDHKSKDGSVTVQGIRVTIDKDQVTDWDVVEGIATLQDDSADESEKLVSSVRVMRRLLGGDYGRVKTELRAANDGKLTAEHMGAFLKEVFEALNPNS